MALIAKSVRIPEDIVLYIDSREGTNFTSKLVDILDEYIYEEKNRSESLKSFDDAIEKRRIRTQLRDIRENINELSLLADKIGK